MEHISEQARPDAGWVADWGQGLTDISLLQQRFQDQTLRIVVPISLAGERLRVRLSNAFGHEPLLVGAAHIARGADGATPVPGTGRALTFGGGATVSIPAGVSVSSDPANLALPAGAHALVSLYLPLATPLTTGNFSSVPIFSSPAGDFTAAPDAAFVVATPFELSPGITVAPPLPLLAGVDVLAGAGTGAIVAFGSSITHAGWPLFLAERLRTAGLAQLSVINQGISGNRILYDGAGQYGALFGRAGVTRFSADALEQPGVRYVLVLHGTNDLGHPGDVAPAAEEVSADEMIAGLGYYKQQAQARGARIIGGTITPFAGYHAWSPEREAKRQAVNSWIRAGNLDGVFDADAAIRDPSRPERLLPAYDGGDHLHPGSEGLRAIAASVDLNLFRHG